MPHIMFNYKVYGPRVTVEMQVSSMGYVYRQKTNRYPLTLNYTGFVSLSMTQIQFYIVRPTSVISVTIRSCQIHGIISLI